MESRFAVGSSANTNIGLGANALATATRCCCPPDSSDGNLSALSSNPVCRSNSNVRCYGTLMNDTDHPRKESTSSGNDIKIKVKWY